VNLTLCDDRSCFLVVLKVIAVNLVKAICLTSVNDDVDIVQLGAATLLVLRDLGGMNGEESASTLALGKREPLRSLLNIDSDARGQILESDAKLVAGIEVKTGYHRDDRKGQDGKPDSQARD
jgi:hypothetical protein